MYEHTSKEPQINAFSAFIGCICIFALIECICIFCIDWVYLHFCIDQVTVVTFRHVQSALKYFEESKSEADVMHISLHPLKRQIDFSSFTWALGQQIGSVFWSRYGLSFPGMSEKVKVFLLASPFSRFYFSEYLISKKFY